jgi:hypothetical protein
MWIAKTRRAIGRRTSRSHRINRNRIQGLKINRNAHGAARNHTEERTAKLKTPPV